MRKFIDENECNKDITKVSRKEWLKKNDKNVNRKEI